VCTWEVYKVLATESGRQHKRGVIKGVCVSGRWGIFGWNKLGRGLGLGTIEKQMVYGLSGNKRIERFGEGGTGMMSNGGTGCV
jgi:hypothetical protein